MYTAVDLVRAALAVNAAGGEAEIVLKADITLSKTVWQTAAGLTVTDNALSFTRGTVTLLGEGTASRRMLRITAALPSTAMPC
ncbi:MAG: hypothetical protein ACLUEU_01215 [Oscillospiraceae bacterium]